MNILVIGGGGREHAIIKKLRESKQVTHIYALPGNGGIAKDAQCVPIAACDMQGVAAFVRAHTVDFCIVAPEDPLALGMADMLEDMGVPCFGPSKLASRIEGSKVFAKRLMEKFHIPTARCEVFCEYDKALAYCERASYPLVVKADGLALGKGVTIAKDFSQAAEALKEDMLNGRFGASGHQVVIEEYLEGPEVSVLALTDGKTLRCLPSGMDHKRALDNDLGDNTGGMGVIAPNPYYTEDIARICMRDIFLPTLDAMRREGCPFKGCLYFGLMLTEDGPKVIEYNCRFGDPEAQAMLPLMQGDLLDVMRACHDGTLDAVDFTVKPGASCCVMIASGGYPAHYEKGKAISLGNAEKLSTVYHSGTALDGSGALITSGGRVLGVCAQGDTLKNAIDNAYRAVDEVQFENAYHRRDIGQKALRAGGSK